MLKYSVTNTKIMDLTVSGFVHCSGGNKPLWEHLTITEVRTDSGEVVVPESLQRYEKDAIVYAMWEKGEKHKTHS